MTQWTQVRVAVRDGITENAGTEDLRKLALPISAAPCLVGRLVDAVRDGDEQKATASVGTRATCGKPSR